MTLVSKMEQNQLSGVYLNIPHYGMMVICLEITRRFINIVVEKFSSRHIDHNDILGDVFSGFNWAITFCVLLLLYCCGELHGDRIDDLATIALVVVLVLVSTL